MTPDAHTIAEQQLEVSGGHRLYVQEWGNKNAQTPIIFVHGGPGSSCHDGHKQAFDPAGHRVIFFDQRGCGRSTPYGQLTDNTTADLVADISRIADHFGLATFVLRGGSWGSCLALAYAIAHPNRVSALILNGIFTASKRELDWFTRGEAATFFPEAWQRFLDATPPEHHHNPYAYHNARILGSDTSAVRASAHAVESLEGSLMKLDERRTPAPLSEQFDPVPCTILTHYFTQHNFMPERHILANAHALTMPVWVVQGRYDMVCPPITAYELHHAIPHSKLIWTAAGHKSSERDTASTLQAILLHYQ